MRFCCHLTYSLYGEKKQRYFEYDTLFELLQKIQDFTELNYVNFEEKTFDYLETVSIYGLEKDGFKGHILTLSYRNFN